MKLIISRIIQCQKQSLEELILQGRIYCQNTHWKNLLLEELIIEKIDSLEELFFRSIDHWKKRNNQDP